jgi:hypothetical protein
MTYAISALIILLWVGPIFVGIRAAKQKNRTAHWLWFGVHPIGALITWMVIELSPALRICPLCKGKTNASSKFCPHCSQPFEIPVSAVLSGYRGWAQRHKGCAIAFAIFLGLASFGALVYGLIDITFQNSWIYQDALKRAQSDTEVIELLGAPIKDGWFASGSIELRGSGEGNAELSIPIHGAQMDGSLSVSAKRHSGVWHYQTLEVITSGGKRKVNLLPKQ